MRVFLRDKNPDLMDQYLNQGMFRSIPVFAFFDEDMNEVARFVERPPQTRRRSRRRCSRCAAAPRRAGTSGGGGG